MRRHLIAPLLAASLLYMSATAVATPRAQGNTISVEASDVQNYLQGSFPQQHDALGGLVELTVSSPQLTLPPGERLKVGFDLALATAGSSPVPVGRVGLGSGLRYDTASQGFYLDQPTIDDFKPASNGAQLDASTRELLNAWLADYARKEPIYRIDPAVAALLGTLQVQSAVVRDRRLVVTFNQQVEGLIPADVLSGP